MDGSCIGSTLVSQKCRIWRCVLIRSTAVVRSGKACVERSEVPGMVGLYYKWYSTVNITYKAQKLRHIRSKHPLVIITECCVSSIYSSTSTTGIISYKDDAFVTLPCGTLKDRTIKGAGHSQPWSCSKMQPPRSVYWDLKQHHTSHLWSLFFTTCVQCRFSGTGMNTHS